jgi:hypothetical protein
MKKLFKSCASGHLYTGATCPFDGTALWYDDLLELAKETLQQKGIELSVEALRGFGLRDEDLRWVVVVDFGSTDGEFDGIWPFRMFAKGVFKHRLGDDAPAGGARASSPSQGPPSVRVDAEDWQRTYGLDVSPSRLDEVRAALAEETAKENVAQGNGDTELMRLCCYQLYRAGSVEDSLAIWHAKEASFDAACSIEVQFLCGAGLEETKSFLAGHGSAAAARALSYLQSCEHGGELQGFTVEGFRRAQESYYVAGEDVGEGRK